MPRLLVLAACDKIITDRYEDVASLIGVMEQVQVTIPANFKPIPADLKVPLRWAVFMIWRPEPTDAAEHYEVRIQVYSPSGLHVHSPIILQLNLPATSKGARLIGRANDFPAGESGEYGIRVAIREKGAANWDERGNYPFSVVHAIEPQEPSSPAPSTAIELPMNKNRKRARKRSS